MFKLSVSLCKLCSLLVVVIGCRKCSTEPFISCTCKLFAAHLLFDVITEQINDDDDDDDYIHIFSSSAASMIIKFSVQCVQVVINNGGCHIV